MGVVRCVVGGSRNKSRRALLYGRDWNTLKNYFVSNDINLIQQARLSPQAHLIKTKYMRHKDKIVVYITVQKGMPEFGEVDMPETLVDDYRVMYSSIDELGLDSELAQRLGEKAQEREDINSGKTPF
jgi:hypothetical protein